LNIRVSLRGELNVFEKLLCAAFVPRSAVVKQSDDKTSHDFRRLSQ
jgi:hypothetical protein